MLGGPEIDGSRRAKELRPWVLQEITLKRSDTVLEALQHVTSDGSILNTETIYRIVLYAVSPS
jgi:hypothetical protein